MVNGQRPHWSQYQEDVAHFFRSLGMPAETNVTIKSPIGRHDIDVVVRPRLAGIELLWLVECKHWSSPVEKLHVLGFRQIVTDTGADRGFMMAEKGFQSGAHDVATASNVTLTSIAELGPLTAGYLRERRIKLLGQQVDGCEARISALQTTTQTAEREWRTQSLRGAGELITLRGRLSMLEHGLKQARLNKLPASYGFEADGNTLLRAHTMAELLESLERTIAGVETDLREREERVSRGPDVDVWRQRRQQ